MTAGTVGPKELSDVEIRSWLQYVIEMIKILVLTGYAHIDHPWLWPVRESQQAVLETAQSTVDRMNGPRAIHRAMTHTASSSEHYRIIEQHDPELFEQIRRLVATERWTLSGGMTIEPDCNLPSGEAFARLALDGQRYFLSRFGRLAEVAANQDAFGHNVGMIQINQLSRLVLGDVGTRPQNHEAPDLPGYVMWWRDNAGRVQLYFRPYPEYTAGPNSLLTHLELNTQALEFGQLVAQFAFIGIGNHGGGITERMLTMLEELMQTHRAPIRFGTLTQFMQTMASQDLPVVQGDVMQHHARGCYMTEPHLKWLLRNTDHQLLAAEKMLTMLELTGLPTPQALAAGLFPKLREARAVYNKNLFHDIAPGTALKIALTEAKEQIGGVRAIAQEALDTAAIQLAWNVRTEVNEPTTPVTVCNPNPHETALAVEVDFNIDPKRRQLPIARTEDGQQVPCQWAAGRIGRHGVSDLVIQAPMPAFGHQTFHVEFVDAAQYRTTCAFRPIRATDTTITTKLVRLQIDPVTGNIARLVSRRLRHRTIRGQACVPWMIEDPTDTWGHSIVSYDGARSQFGPAHVYLLETGPARAIIRAVSTYDCTCTDVRRCRCTQLIRDYVVYRDSELVEIRLNLDWHEKLTAMKVAYPFSLTDPDIVAEASFSSSRGRVPDGQEEPCQSFVTVTGRRRDGSHGGFAIITDGVFGYSATKRAVELTVHRSPAYSHHDPSVLDPARWREEQWTGQGEHDTRQWIVPIEGSWEAASLSRLSTELNQPQVIQRGTFRPMATLPQRASYASLDSSQVVLTALKPHEDGLGRIVRLYNSGSPTSATFAIAGRTVSAQFALEEVKTFLIPDDPEAEVRETDFLEL